jgi:hypothetical protein
MSLKFAVLGTLTALSDQGIPKNHAQALGPVGPQEPILTFVGVESSAAEQEKPEMPDSEKFTPTKTTIHC